MKHKITGFLAIICTVTLIVLCLYFGLQRKHSRPGLKNDTISTQIKRRSGGCAQMNCRGNITFSDGSIPVFDQKSFTLTYNASATAKVNLGNVDIKIQGDTIKISLPPPEITSVTVDNKTISFSRNTYSVFNWTAKSDVTCAIAHAKEITAATAKQSPLMDEAVESAKTAVKSLYKNLRTPEGKSYKISFS